MSDPGEGEWEEQDGSSVEAYTVGYGKPPKDTRWKPGQSGNPSGRKKAVPTLGDDLKREAASLMTITEGGRSRRVRKSHALVKALFTHAFMGRVGTTRVLVQLMEKANLTAPTPAPEADEWMETTEEVLDKLIAAAQKVKGTRAEKKRQAEGRGI